MDENMSTSASDIIKSEEDEPNEINTEINNNRTDQCQFEEDLNDSQPSNYTANGKFLYQVDIPEAIVNDVDEDPIEE